MEFFTIGVYNSTEKEFFDKLSQLLNDSKIENEYLKNLNIDFNITHQEIDDEFLFYIKSVLFHELLHIFQHYNIIINSKFTQEFYRDDTKSNLSNLPIY